MKSLQDMPNDTNPLESYYFKHISQQICARAVPPITNDYVENYPTVIDRFYTRYYYIKRTASGEADPYKVLFHSNRICLICLAAEHLAMKIGVSGIDFDIGNSDRSKNAVKGKGKKGGMILSPETTLAILTTNDGKTYKLPSCLKGKLIEVNEAVIQDPKVLASPREGEGYLAIVLLNLGNSNTIKDSLITQEEYDKLKANQFCEVNNEEKLLSEKGITTETKW